MTHRHAYIYGVLTGAMVAFASVNFGEGHYVAACIEGFLALIMYVGLAGHPAFKRPAGH